jgi:hypothetical protein
MILFFIRIKLNMNKFNLSFHLSIYLLCSDAEDFLAEIRREEEERATQLAVELAEEKARLEAEKKEGTKKKTTKKKKKKSTKKEL